MANYASYVDTSVEMAKGIIEGDLLQQYDIDDTALQQAEITIGDLVQETLAEIRSHMECYAPEMLTDSAIIYCFESIMECYGLL